MPLSPHQPAQQELHLDLEGQRHRLQPGDRVTLGRGLDCDITVRNRDVSRRHAVIEHDGGRWVIRDLGSSNGTHVGGVRVVGAHPVSGGESVLFGGSDGVAARIGMSGASPRTEGDITGATYDVSVPSATPAPPRTTVSPPAASPSAMPVRPVPAPTPIPAHARARGDESVTQAVEVVASQEVAPIARPTPARLPKAGGVPLEKRATGDIFESWNGTLDAEPTGQLTVDSGALRAMPAPAGAITIGRGLDNDIVVHDLLASRAHARLTPQHGGYLVEDLGSSNGTYVNGSQITRTVLHEGDLLVVGHTRLTLQNGTLVARQDSGDVTFVANHLSFTLPSGKKLLDDVSFALEGSSLVAVIGPSGAGKSTLLKALVGAQKATEGEVYYEGRDLYENFDDLRHRIGLVPQDDVVHHQLTVREALGYAAELRFPSDLPRPEREARVESVIAQLDLVAQADTPVSKLSGGQRKRTSVALELLTEPSLLFLDEPTSGLDPGLDKRVMRQLRDLADDGNRTVVVITHSVASLSLCDHVLLLAPGGKVAYFGPPDGMLDYFEDADDHADIFTIASRDPDGVQAAFRRSALMDAQVEAPLSAPRTAEPDLEPKAARRQSIPRQISTLVRRQLRVLLADRGLLGFMALMPIVLAGLIALVPGDHGLSTVTAAQLKRVGGTAAGMVDPPAESQQIMTLLVMGSLFMGLSATIRELVGERSIFLREKSVGLSSFAYVASKVLTFGTVVALQCAVLVGLVLAAKGTPDHAVALGSTALELFVVSLLTAWASLALGLALSSLARTSDQVMPMLVITVMAALVFSGGLFPLTAGIMQTLAGVSPSRWGLTMAAQTADVRTTLQLDAFTPVKGDVSWRRDASTWRGAGLALLVQFVIGFAVAWIFTRRRRTV